MALIRSVILIGGGFALWLSPNGTSAAANKVRLPDIIFPTNQTISLMIFYEKHTSIQPQIYIKYFQLTNVVFAFMLIILAFAPSKLLAFYEDPKVK